MTRLVVEPTRSSLMHDWLSSELEQCGFDGNYTSRCIFNIVDRQADSGPRIGSCPTMSLWAWDEADCAPRPSSATTPEVRSGRRSWSASSDEELKREAVIDLLRLMVSTEVCRSVVFVFLTFDFTALTDLLCHVTGLACLSVCLYVCSFISLYDISYACIFWLTRWLNRHNQTVAITSEETQFFNKKENKIICNSKNQPFGMKSTAVVMKPV